MRDKLCTSILKVGEPEFELRPLKGTAKLLTKVCSSGTTRLTLFIHSYIEQEKPQIYVEMMKPGQLYVPMIKDFKKKDPKNEKLVYDVKVPRDIIRTVSDRCELLLNFILLHAHALIGSSSCSSP